MNFSRRHLITSTVLAGLFFSTPTKSILFSGGPPSGGGAVLLETRQIVNDGVGTAAANSHPPSFGLSFKDGDMPVGEYPQLKTSMGSTVPYTCWGKSTWPSGCLKFLGVLPRFPDSISAAATADLKVWTGGSAPSASSRTNAEVYAADFDMYGDDALDSLTGDWIAALQTANIIETVVIGDGPAGKYVRYLVEYKQGGTPDGQLHCYFYVMILQDGSGNLAGFRVFARSVQPYYNDSLGTKDFVSFTTWKLRSSAGANVIDPMSGYAAKTTTWANSGINNSAMTATAHGWNNGTAVRATTTGTLPTGINANQTYWVLVVDANTVYLMEAPAVGASFNGTEQEVVSGAGSGTHTLTPVPYNCYFCSYVTAQTNGRMHYIQGGGSVASEPDLRNVADVVYDHTTRIYPPYDLSVASVQSNSSNTWKPYNAAGLAIFIGTTGERPDIGILTSYVVRHFLKQAAVDESYARAIGLCGGHFAICLRDKTSGGLINLSAGTYAGMPASQSTYKYRPSNSTVTGFTAPIAHHTSVQGAYWNQVFNSVDASHMPQLAAYGYAAFAEWQYYDYTKEMSNAIRLWSEPFERNVTLNAVDYKNIGPCYKGLRDAAWSYRDPIWCAILSPDTDPDGSAFTTYIRDSATLQGTYLAAWIASLNSWMTTSGYFVQQAGQSPTASWMMGYMWSTMLLHANGMQDANALLAATHCSKWPPYVVGMTGSVYMLCSYYENCMKSAPPYTANVFIDTDAEWGALASQTGGMSWTIAGNLFTLTSPGFTLANGDKYNFRYTANKPGTNFTVNTAYYAINVSGNTFQLSATPGGSAIVVQADGSLDPQDALFIVPVNPPSTGIIGGAIADEGYSSNQSFCCDWSIASGITTTGLSAAASALRTRNAAVNYAVSMKYRAQQTY